MGVKFELLLKKKDVTHEKGMVYLISPSVFTVFLNILVTSSFNYNWNSIKKQSKKILPLKYYIRISNLFYSIKLILKILF